MSSLPRPTTLAPRAAQRTARGRETFLAVLSASPVPALLVDVDHRALSVLAANEAARRSLPSSGPLVGGDLSDVLGDDDLGALVAAATEVVGGRLPSWTHETEETGPLVTTGLTLSRLATPGESPLVVLQLLERPTNPWSPVRADDLLLRAREAEREAVRRLAALERAKDDFLTTVGHELRTPLASILGFTEMLRDEGPDGATAADLLERVRRNGERLLELVEGMAMLARVGSTPVPVDAPDVDLRDVVRRAVTHVACTAGARGQRLEVHLPEGPVVIAGHDADLTRAVDELLDNGVKFTPAGGSITVSLSQEDSRCVLVVADTGHGIPADEQAHVFEPFARAARTVDTVVPGTGIGLALLRAVVTTHGGCVEVSSASSGTRFTVRLPLRRG